MSKSNQNILGIYTYVDVLVDAIKKLRAEGFENLRVFSPVPNHITDGSFGSIVTHPVEYVDSLSNIGVYVVPEFSVFHTPLDPVATYQTLLFSGWIAISAILPDKKAGPTFLSFNAESDNLFSFCWVFADWLFLLLCELTSKTNSVISDNNIIFFIVY